ncbi:amidohydrolase family protein [Paenibacillus sp. Soil787]|uniref:amidohydrolase family protein n=1 Tax=Paenibacillus sp. Soil787 TaxID=1736411 RepID=UPI0012E38D6F|nr:amidohydrolase family protein [Paenibacillus sp. Soil787]
MSPLVKLLSSYDLTFDVVGVFPNHLKHIPYLAEKVPDLRIVIDHFAIPPIKEKQMGAWAE